MMPSRGAARLGSRQIAVAGRGPALDSLGSRGSRPSSVGRRLGRRRWRAAAGRCAAGGGQDIAAGLRRAWLGKASRTASSDAPRPALARRQARPACQDALLRAEME